MRDTFKVDFVGIGSSKAGTTWLGHMLEDHPELCMSVPKEVHFFNDILAYRNPNLEKNYSKGISWYKKHFNHCGAGKIIGEITPRYTNDPLVPNRIKAHNPDMKIFIFLRNPVDRINSHYNFAKYYIQKEDRPMDQAIKEQPEFIDMSLYHKTLSRYLEHFPKEQIFLVWFEDIRERPDELLENVYTFLGVDSSFRPKGMKKKSNPGRKKKFKRIQQFVHAVNQQLVFWGFSGLAKTLKKVGTHKFVMKIISRPLQKDKMSLEVKAYIIDQVKDDVNQLQEWTGKDLSHWLT